MRNADDPMDLRYAERIAQLVRLHLAEKLTAGEERELDAWIRESDEHVELFETLINTDNILSALRQYQQSEIGREFTLRRIKKAIRPAKEKYRMRRLIIFAIAAALVFAAVTIYLFSNLD